jgi:GNAT superfamily N-acetyltransferase
VTLAGITVPVPLLQTHDLEPFDCGDISLNEWLKARAHKSRANDSARTYVVCIGNTVVGYYCLAFGAIAREQAPKEVGRNMPDPIPVIILGRFTVDLNYQSKGIGSGLLKDAILRALQVSEIVGVKAILVHAISEEAKSYYMARNFLVSPIHPRTLCLPVNTARQAL